MNRILTTALLVGFAGPVIAAGESISLAEAKQAAEAAVAFARTSGAPGGAIAIVDSGGQNVYLGRLDGSFPASGAISVGKARTAPLVQESWSC